MRALPWVFMCWVALAASFAIAEETPKPWESVRIVGDSHQVEGCRLIGEVKGKSSWGGAMQSYAESKAYQHIKQNALKMGANTVLMVTGHSSWGGSKYRGEAYLCGTPDAVPTPAPTTPSPAATQTPEGGER
jgi:hypothetical protein